MIILSCSFGFMAKMFNAAGETLQFSPFIEDFLIT
jgi:hypothetical protein